MKKKKRLKNKALTDNLLNSQTSISWDELSDADRSRYLIGSTRLSDSDPFLTRFGSWSYPDPDYSETTSNK